MDYNSTIITPKSGGGDFYELAGLEKGDVLIRGLYENLSLTGNIDEGGLVAEKDSAAVNVNLINLYVPGGIDLEELQGVRSLLVRGTTATKLRFPDFGGNVLIQDSEIGLLDLSFLYYTIDMELTGSSIKTLDFGRYDFNRRFDSFRLDNCEIKQVSGYMPVGYHAIEIGENVRIPQDFRNALQSHIDYIERRRQGKIF
jgi:hypothetical protein